MGYTRKFLNWYARLSPAYGHKPPPYEHVVQVGDPVLRKVSEKVPLDKIKTSEIQKIIEKLIIVLTKYDSIGISAPQIGVNKRIFAMKCTVKDVALMSKEVVRRRGISVIPLTVFINPALKVVDFMKITQDEGCESIKGLCADVPRYKAVQVTGYSPDGEPKTETYHDWTARVVQHEMDHLDGKLYTDIMDRKSLYCTCWQEINMAKGKLVIPFCPK